MFLLNFANVIGGKKTTSCFPANLLVSQRHDKYQLSEPEKVKSTTTTTTNQNGQSKKTAPPAPATSSPITPPAEVDSDRGSVEFFEFTGES